MTFHGNLRLRHVGSLRGKALELMVANDAKTTVQNNVAVGPAGPSLALDGYRLPFLVAPTTSRIQVLPPPYCITF